MECIGLVYVDLNPLLTQTAREDYDDGGGGIIDGWFPLYDTLGGELPCSQSYLLKFELH
jgi:hypothetical protein